MLAGRLTPGALAALLGFAGQALGADLAPPPRDGAAVARHLDVAYRTGPAADAARHKLDVYTPKGKADFPVVLFVHGGQWEWGDKALYGGFGETFARAGVGVVVCNYRLSPKVRHPAHAEDVAGAFAWTCANIGKYGGDPKKLFVCGHSAGGHLVSLLATEPSLLKAEGRAPDDIRGVIAISGVYKIYHTEKVFHAAFGKDEELCRKASPVEHVTGKHPPFLLAYGDKDYQHLDTLAKDMHGALGKAGSPSELLVCKNRDHISIVFGLLNPDDPLRRRVSDFILGPK